MLMTRVGGSTPRATLLAGIVALVYCGTTLYQFAPLLVEPYLVTDDACQHIAPIYSFLYPDVLQGDFLTDYKLAYLPPGFRWLYRAGAAFMDPLLLSKILTFALLLATWALAFLVGRALAGPVCGLFTMCLFAHSEFLLYAIFGAFFRGFAPPLLLVFILFCIRERFMAAALVLPFLSAFYPPVFLVCWGALGLAWLPRVREWFTTQRAALITYALVSVISLLMLVIFSKPGKAYGNIVTLEEAGEMPEWSRHGGRVKVLPFPGIGQDIVSAMRKGMLSSEEGVSFIPSLVSWNAMRKDMAFWAFLGLTGLSLVWVKPTPWWWFALLVSSIWFYLLARWAAFSIGWPIRYLHYTLSACLLLLYPLLWRTVRQCLPGRPGWTGLLLALPLALVFLFHPAGWTGIRAEKATDASALRPVVEFLRSLPEPVLVAGWPRHDLDYLYLFAHKKVLVDYESAHPLYLDYYDEVRKRTRDILRLVFVGDPGKAAAIRDRYGLSHLVLNKHIVREETGVPLLYEPWNRHALRVKKRGLRRGLLFADPPQAWRVLETDKYLVVDLRRMER